MAQKVIKILYRLTGGKALKEIPVKMLQTSCYNTTLSLLSDKLESLESLGYVNTFKTVVKGESRIHSVELTTYGKSILQSGIRE